MDPLIVWSTMSDHGAHAPNRSGASGALRKEIPGYAAHNLPKGTYDINLTRFAYLVSQYPAFNHTFILREIRSLRQQGFSIAVISIRACDRPPERLTVEEREELDLTWYVKPLGWAGLLAQAALVALTRPGGFVAGLAHAWRLAGPNPVTLARYSFYFLEAAAAARRLHQQGIPHFHVHFSSTVGLLMTSIYPLTMSMTIHGPDEFNDPVGFHMAEKVSASKLVAAISSFCRSQLMRFSRPQDWDKFAVSRLGVDPAIFAPRPHRPNPERFEFLCVGRLAPAKAQLILIRACGLLAQRGRVFRLRIIGEGPDRPVLEAEIRRQNLGGAVVLTGALNQDEVRALYQECDVFTLGSFAEGVPVVLMEAMAMEIPCISTYIAGIPELITDGVDGLLVPASDGEALAAAIERLMDDVPLRHRLGSAGRRRVQETYDLGRNVQQLGELFRRRLG
jgi:glycosyltransferase involved in cell wall biosynthesis